ncbi:MAG: minichromosome maintenance protein MCM [Candidatus Micrarchaeota archaeon]|nr:minichromosome maintenance protein MCM [Candidatus Micrarchaeota archaeon]
MEKVFDDSQLQQLWEEFVEKYYKEDLAQLELEYPTKKSLIINFEDIQKFNPDLADFLVENPDIALNAFEKTIKKNKAGILEIDFSPHVRIAGLKDNDLMIQNISSKHIDKLLTVKGIITKRAEVMHKVKIAFYRCLMCDYVLKVPLTKKTIAPENCPECKKKALTLDEENSYFVDIQRAECQELLERVRGGAPAAKIELYLEDDNVNKIMPGESVELTGILRLKTPTKTKGAKAAVGATYSRYLEVNYINPIHRDFEEIKINEQEVKKILEMAQDKGIYERLQKALAPGIYGHDEVKLAIVLQMFGGTKGKTLPGGVPIRDDIHILLIGDPGSAKSRMLQYAKELVPKGIYVSGKSATGAGLTATAEKDELGEGGWTLKAGALVLANGGLACIDEFDKMTEDERSAMHEAMETQTISVAKAGIVATFRTKCAILAAANPKYGRFDPNRLPAEQFNLTPTILSRFDLIFAIYDVLDKVRDSEMADAILSAHREKYKQETKAQEEDREIIRKYIAYMRKNIFPKLSEEASEKIKQYYIELRERGQKQGAVPITPRQIEGIIRLTEASAKVRGSNIATAEDAQRAINLLNFMHDQILRDRQTGAIDIDIVSTGRPQSERNKINLIFGIIREFSEKYDEIPIEEIVAEASKNDINEHEAIRIINDMILTGEIYKPRAGYVKLVKELK